MDREDLRYYLGSIAECEHEGIVQTVSVHTTDRLGFVQHIKATEDFDSIMEDTSKIYHVLCADNTRAIIKYDDSWEDWDTQWIPWVFNN